VELCVVGDDDQAICQWRGADVRNIIEFASRYPGVRTFKITVNRRSRPHIVEAAASFACSLPDRLDKEMSAFRDPNPAEVVTWAADTEAEECDRIAETIQRLHAAGLPYRHAAVLVRTRAAYPRLLEALDAHGVPAQPSGRTGLFARPEAQMFGKTYAWLVDPPGPRSPTPGVRSPPTTRFLRLPRPLWPGRRAGKAGGERLLALKASVPGENRPVNLVADFYELRADLGVAAWDADDPMTSSRAACERLLRSRPLPSTGWPGGWRFPSASCRNSSAGPGHRRLTTWCAIEAGAC
jgi:DNA helicase-2/ATP-dependent DNA helicase PcrA